MAQSRRLSVENFKKWMNTLLKTHIWNMVTSQDLQDRLSSLTAIDGSFSVCFCYYLCLFFVFVCLFVSYWNVVTSQDSQGRLLHSLQVMVRYLCYFCF
jgi:hypothetical protein